MAISLMDASTGRAFSRKSVCLFLKARNWAQRRLFSKEKPGMSLPATVYDFSDKLIFLMARQTNPEYFFCLFLYVGNTNIAYDTTQFSLKR